LLAAGTSLGCNGLLRWRPTARAALWQSAESEPVPNYDAEAIAFAQMDAEHIEKMMTEVDEEVIESAAIPIQQP